MTDTARRPANARQRELVRWLLQHAASPASAAVLLGTVDQLQVVDACDCGCPSVDFVREGQGAGAQIVAEARGVLPDGCPVTVLLWTRDGAISGLEVFDYDGGTWFPLPSPSHLNPVTRENNSVVAT